MGRGSVHGRAWVGGRGGVQKKETVTSHPNRPQHVEAAVSTRGDNTLSQRGGLRLMVVDSVFVNFVCVDFLFVVLVTSICVFVCDHLRYAAGQS